MSARRPRRPRRVSSRRQHLVGLTVSIVCLLAAIAAIGVGVRAWTMDRPEPMAVESNVDVAPGSTPWFDPGSTLFAAPVGDERAPQPDPVSWACTLTTAGVETELSRRPSRDTVGTRVVDGLSVVPVVTIGPTDETSVLLCTGEAARSTAGMWVLPTSPGTSRTPLALVVGGIALAGIAAVAHPRARNLRPFGR